MRKSRSHQIISVETIERWIFLIRGHKVMLDNDLAELYGVTTKRLNEQVRRNIKRFPPDFMFQLTFVEAKSLRSQFATLEKSGRGRHRKYFPYAFTEQGIAMLSSVLNSERAIQVNITIMRAFVKLRQLASAHSELAKKLAELEKRTSKHDKEIQAIFEVIRRLMTPPTRAIGYHIHSSAVTALSATGASAKENLPHNLEVPIW
ncbi:MAG: ORF6N domain-containing protein [Candidatus Omnitrophica bacterium]|nr:ORF6N domain-containing protein [Candidatus Omnitrophota bacterium]